MARPGRNTRIPIEQWLTKAKLSIKEAGFALARYEDLDETGQPCYDGRPTREVLNSIESGETGNYVIIDDQGECVSECTIGRSGVRTTPQSYSAERQSAMLVTNLSESWERRCNAAERTAEKLEKKNDKLDFKLQEKQLEVDKLKEMLFDAQNEDASEPWRKLAEEAMGLFKGHKIQGELMRVLSSPQVWGQLSPSAQKEIVAVLNSGAVVAVGSEIIVEGESVQ